MQQQAILSPKGEVFAQFHAVTVVCGMDCLTCQNEYFVNNPLDVKEIDSLVIIFHWRFAALSQGHNHKSSSRYQ
jgi:hypothetical protein